MLTILRLDQLVFATHDMSWPEVERWRDRLYLDGGPPILVELIAEVGRYFVHDGRHRATAAYELGHRDIVAELVA